MPDVWFEYDLGVEGVTQIVTLRWYTSDNPEEPPFLVEQQRHTLTDPAVTTARVLQAVRDRTPEVRRGLGMYLEIQAAFGAGVNTRMPAPQ